jgi:hypothetical protein
MNTAEHDFAYVAFWQFLTFFALMLIVWVNELWDLAALVYGTTPRSPNVFSASVLSAAVILIAIITVLHTYHQQKRIIRGLLTVCSYCHKVKVDEKLWEQMESFVADRSLASFSHGICPECFQRVSGSLDEHQRTHAK